MSAFKRTREAVAAQLQTDLDIRVYQGVLDEPNSPGQHVACIFSTGRAPYSADVLMAEIEFVVRAFAKSSGVAATPETPLDPTDLEDLEEQILVSLKPRQADTTIQDGYFVWDKSDFDHVSRYVEITFHTWQTSPFGAGG